MEITTNLKKSKKKGFTLIELIIVIAIIGIIALIAIPKFGNAQKEAKINADLASAKTIANATSMLITKGEIGLPEADMDKPEALTDKIKSQLQNVPTPKSETDGTQFGYTITTDGDVAVFILKEDGTSLKQVYPNK